MTDVRVPAFMREKEAQIGEMHHKSFQKAFKAGVKIAAGTDMIPLLCANTIAKEIRLIATDRQTE